MTTTHQLSPISNTAPPGGGVRPVLSSPAGVSGEATSHPPPGQIDQLEQILPLLTRWTGGMASLWTYSISHGKLVVRLTRPNVRGNLHLMMFDCRRICAPTFWGNTAVQLLEESTAEGRRFVLRDDAAKVEIRCGYVVAAENVEPIY